MASLVSAVMPSSGNWSSLARSQLEVLQSLVKKHLEDPSLADIASGDDFTLTSIERGIPRYEHSHLVAALDVILEYLGSPVVPFSLVFFVQGSLIKKPTPV